MASMQLKVCTPGGEQFEIQLAAGDTVRQLREAVENQKGGLEPATCLKLLQGGRVLLDDLGISELSEEALVMAVVTRETRLDILLHASSHCSLYKDLLGTASREEGSRSTAVMGPFPTILKVLEELRGEAVDMEHLKPGAMEGSLEFSGRNGDLLLPSLDAEPLRAAVGSSEPLEAITLSVAVNSDAYNQGLGIVIEASPLVCLPADFPELKVYTYNGYGLQNEGRRRNALKFHPGMMGGQLRMEGAGGFHNSSVGFTPKSWSESGKKPHTLEVTLRTNGNNTVRLLGSEPGQEWERPWQNMLFDGLHVPAIYAWLDLGSRSRPLHVGPIMIQGHFAQGTPDSDHVVRSAPARDHVVQSTPAGGVSAHKRHKDLSSIFECCPIA
mmetsp:Transcript_41456/g.109324  ORF Transcript_41456/g.109324 Transcript_41456/m.109324 type:complete len:384 (-) Transcript_41456:216-1367(-)